MTFLTILLIIGIAVGAGKNSLMKNRGNALGFPLSVGERHHHRHRRHSHGRPIPDHRN